MFYFYLKSYNKFYEDIFFAKDLSNGKIFRFLDIVQIQGKNDSVTRKIFCINSTDTVDACTKDLINMQTSAPNEKSLDSKIPNKRTVENFKIAQRCGKTISIWSDKFSFLCMDFQYNKYSKWIYLYWVF